MEKLMLTNKVQIFMCTLHPQFATQSNILFNSSNSLNFPHNWNILGIKQASNNPMKVCGVRRRRINTESDTYVLMEPGKNEEFVTEDELSERLRNWLENWPGDELPTDLARFDSIDDAVLYLVKSVCELEIDGDVGSIQWYQVRLD
ncbi:hypothetical protein ACP275_08G031100 [Erythranthe tilingii]